MITIYEQLSHFVDAIRAITDTIEYQIIGNELILQAKDPRSDKVFEYRSRLRDPKRKSAELIFEGIKTQRNFKFVERIGGEDWQ